MFKKIMTLCCLLLSSACQSAEPVSEQTSERSTILVFAGQSVRATLDYYNSAIIPRPDGFSDYIAYDVGTSYKSFAPDYPKVYQGNEGLFEATNWGGGVQCVACNLANPKFSNAAINIGMYIAGPQYDDGSICSAKPSCNTQRMVDGDFDSQLNDFAQWLKAHAEHRVLLRIGYEFDGSWNAYDPEQFKAAYKYIYRFFNDQGVNNVEYVLHTYGYASRETLQLYFPEPDQYSDNYVDWLGYSYFTQDNDIIGRQELAMAREKGIKVFIGEAAPHTGDCALQMNIAENTAQAKHWIDSFVEHLKTNSDVIGAIAYINENWSDKQYAPMWDDQQDQNCGGFFARSNSRLQDNPVVESYWAEAISRPPFRPAAKK